MSVGHFLIIFVEWIIDNKANVYKVMPCVFTIVVLDHPRVLRVGGELVLDNFNLNLLQLVIVHIISADKPRILCTVHNNLHGNPKWEKTTE